MGSIITKKASNGLEARTTLDSINRGAGLGLNVVVVGDLYNNGFNYNENGNQVVRDLIVAKGKALNLLESHLASEENMGSKLNELGHEMEKLRARELDCRVKVKNDKISPGKIPKEVVVQWLKDVERMKGEHKTIEDSIKSGSQIYINDIDKLIRVAKGLVQQGEFATGVVLDDPNGKSTCFLLTDMIGENCRENFETILGWLKSCESKPIGVWGLGGVGKTMLLEHLYNHLNNHTEIAGRAYWVVVSNDCNLFGLQHKIAVQIGIKDFSEDNLKKRAFILQEKLSTIERKVLFLDDMWDMYDFEDIGIPREGSSCQIILSTRRRDICNWMCCAEYVIKVKVLQEWESWRLFEKKLNVVKPLAGEVKKLAVEVANKCGNLPLAIKTVAGSMKGETDVHVWRNALNDLINVDIIPCDMEEEVYAPLKFSYDRLKDEILKRCFLSCVLYPEDYAILKEELIGIWMGGGLLDFAGEWEKQVSKGHTIINKLLNSSLIEEWSNGRSTVKVHDIIRDMAIVITQSQPHFIAKAGLKLREVPKKTLPWTEDVTNVSFMQNKIEGLPLDMSPNCPKLTTLMLRENPLEGIPEFFFVHMHALSFLDLSYTRIKHLPENVSKLKNLRALMLGGCTDLEYVPCVTELTELRMLSLLYCYKVGAPKGMEYLEKLEELVCHWSNIEWDYFTELMRCSRFQELSSYLFYLYSDDINTEFSCKQGYVSAIESEFKRAVVMHGGSWKRNQLTLPATMEYLKIRCCEFEESDGGIEDVLQDMMSVVIELRHLKISCCKGLGSILPLSPAFSSLGVLELKRCGNVKVVFRHQQHTNLPNLVYLSVVDCDEVEEIFGSRIATGSGSANKKLFILHLPILMFMELRQLPKLRHIFNGGILISDVISDPYCCPKLKWVKPLYSVGVVCDESESSLASIKACIQNNPQYWQDFQHSHPRAADALHIIAKYDGWDDYYYDYYYDDDDDDPGDDNDDDDDEYDDDEYEYDEYDEYDESDHDEDGVFRLANPGSSW